MAVDTMYCEMYCNYTYLDGEYCVELYYDGSTCMTRAATDVAYCEMDCNGSYLNGSECVELSWNGTNCMEIPATNTSNCQMDCNYTYFDYYNWECMNRTWDPSNDICGEIPVNETYCYWDHPHYWDSAWNDTDWDWYTWDDFVERRLNIDSGFVRNCSSRK